MPLDTVFPQTEAARAGKRQKKGNVPRGGISRRRKSSNFLRELARRTGRFPQRAHPCGMSDDHARACTSSFRSVLPCGAGDDHVDDHAASEIEQHGDRRWWRDESLRVDTAADAERFSDQVGFAACLTDARRPGPSLYVAVCERRDAGMPRHVPQDEEALHTWVLKMRSHARPRLLRQARARQRAVRGAADDPDFHAGHAPVRGGTASSSGGCDILALSLERGLDRLSFVPFMRYARRRPLCVMRGGQ
jgi:hypothetical protein